jgi:muramoyltetrapeptide carboxypeptidase
VFAAAGYLAGDDLGRAASFNRLLADPGVHAILCARGGYGSMRLLEAIDYRLAAQRPKRFIGFSDLTALLAALQSRSGLVVFHGPTVTQLAEAEGATLRSVARQLAGSGTVALRAGRVLRTGRASGPLAGGNLTILCHLAGTPYFPPLAGRILLLEDRGEALYRVDRMLRHLQLTGCLEGIAGLALGRFDDCGAPEALDRLVLELVGAAAIPILADLPVGHGRCNRVVPLGVPARLDGERRQLRILLPSPVP